jgi:hypothetical protein
MAQSDSCYARLLLLFPKRNWVIRDVFLDAWTSGVGYSKRLIRCMQQRGRWHQPLNGFSLLSITVSAATLLMLEQAKQTNY